MIRKLFLTIVLFTSCVLVNAQLNSTQSRLRDDIYSALKKIATNVTKYDDETLKFRANDINFFVSISNMDYDPLYVCLMAMFELPKEYDSNLSLAAGMNAANGKPVYVAINEQSIIFDCEMYVKEAKPFVSVLPAMIGAISSSVENFNTEYNKVATTHNTSNNFASPSVNNSNEYVFPEVSQEANDSKLYLTKVTLNSNYTILDITSYNGRKTAYCGIDRNSFLRVNGTKLKLLRAEGIAYVPEHTMYPNAESGNESSLSFKLYFPKLPNGTTSFDFQENEGEHAYEGWNEGWAIKGIKLNNQNLKQFNSETIETAYHSWTCKAINCQSSQTVVIKTVTPKDVGTYMNSSQDEFIEDADTGRKYYLIKSSLGFETNPLISHDRNPVEFAEVYPALPSNVKRINISSGEQYYVKGLVIR